MTNEERNVVLTSIMPELVISHRNLMFAHYTSESTIRISKNLEDFGEITVRSLRDGIHFVLCLNNYFYTFQLSDPDCFSKLIEQIKR